MNRLFTACAGLASVATTAALVGMAAPAMAAPAPVGPASTLACQVTTPGCDEPVVAISQSSGTDFVPADDAALTAQGGGTVFTRQNNSLDNGAQDWTANVDGFVPFFGSGDYGFTSFDRLNWAGRPYISEEWTPFGQSTNLCLNLRSIDKRGVLSPCDGRRGEEFIISSHVPGLFSTGAPGYRYAISVRHSLNTARHLLLTANDTGFGQVYGANPVHHSPGVATQQMWSALP